jgi:uncharacterized alkaline shock family protein YloU
MTATLTPATLTPATERGVTTVAARTVERIAAHTLSEVDNVGGAERRMLGIAVSSADPDGDATVSAVVNDLSVALTVRLSVTYPASVRATARAARAHLMARVAELTGLTVSRVDITVTALPGNATTVRRVR